MQLSRSRLSLILLTASFVAAFWFLARAQQTGKASPALQPGPAPQPPVVARPPVGLHADTHLDRTPPRQTKGLHLVKTNWTYNCMECHKLLPAKWHYDRPMVEHERIRLEHGENRFCLNCHHPTNRSAFVDYDGSEIAEQEVVLLCAKCHGPTYRDWKAGAHGRRSGFWDTTKGSQTRLLCIQCHDPHQPRFQSITPLAPLRYPVRAAHPPGKSKTGAAEHASRSTHLSPVTLHPSPAAP